MMDHLAPSTSGTRPQDIKSAARLVINCLELSAASKPSTRKGRFGFQFGDDSPAKLKRRFRWKMMTRVLTYFIRWEKIRNSGRDRGFVMRRLVAGRVQERVFNVKDFCKTVKQYQILTTHAKLLLYKEPAQRSSQDELIILGYFNRMVCFNKYSVFTKRELAKRVRYNCYQKGDVIFSQGQHPQFFYLMLSGGAQDYQTEEGVLKPVGSPIREGDGFGELGIVHDHPRLVSVILTEHSEIFTLEKEDFKKLLLEYHDEERTRRSTHITSIPEISSVPEGDIQKAIDSSYIKHFNKGEIIIDGSERKSGKPRSSKEKVQSCMNSPEHFAYIVVSGSVVLEKRIVVCQKALPCGTTIVNLDQHSDQADLINIVKSKINSHPIQAPNTACTWKQRYLSVKTFVVGDMFCSLDLEDGYVIGAKEATEILYLPKMPFMLHKLGEPMLKRFDQLSGYKITISTLLEEYNSNRLWKDYRKQLVKQVLEEKHFRRSKT